MKAKRFLAMLLMGCLTVMTLFSFVGCGEKGTQEQDARIVETYFSIYVKKEYEEKFQNKSFTKADFQWENIDDLRYIIWEGDRGLISVLLKEPGIREVNSCMTHVKTLEFVLSTHYSYMIKSDWLDKTEVKTEKIPERIAVYIKNEYKDAFFNEEFTVDDFQIEGISYIWYFEWSNYAERGVIVLEFNEINETIAKQHIEYLKTLAFILDAKIGYKTVSVE